MVPAARLRDCREAWEALHRAAGAHPLLDADFVEPLIAQFGDGDTRLAMDTEASAIALLQADRGLSWETFRPAQQPLGPFLARPGAGAMAMAEDLLRALPGPALRLAIRAQDPACSTLARAHDSDTAEVRSAWHTARVRIDGSFDDYWRSRRRSFRRNLANRRRRLAREGVPVELAVATRAHEMNRELAIFGAVEGTGWKGRCGSAVQPGDAQGRFYGEVLARFAARGCARAYRLLFDGVTVASQLCLEQSGMLVILKMAYDERCKAYAPGYLLREAMLRELFSQRRVGAVEHYGRIRPGWTAKWATDLRPMVDVELYRNRWVRRAVSARRQATKWLEHAREGRAATG